MVEVKLICYLRGDDFSESDIEKSTGIKIHDVTNHKTLNIPIKTYQKVATIIPEENNVIGDDYNLLIKNFSDFIKNKVPIIKKYGCDTIALLADVKYVDQCNMSLDCKVIESVSASFDSFDITCYEVENF